MTTSRIPKSQEDIIAELTAAASNPPNQQDIADIQTVLYEWLTYGESTYSCSFVESQTYHSLSFIYDKSNKIDNIINDLASQFPDVKVNFSKHCGKQVALITKIKLWLFYGRNPDLPIHLDGRKTNEKIASSILSAEGVNDADRIANVICDNIRMNLTALDDIYDIIYNTYECVKKISK